jgi:hypothetical protein
VVERGRELRSPRVGHHRVAPGQRPARLCHRRRAGSHHGVVTQTRWQALVLRERGEQAGDEARKVRRTEAVSRRGHGAERSGASLTVSLLARCGTRQRDRYTCNYIQRDTYPLL